MHISINPTYKCNENCTFCYLSKKDRSAGKIADLDDIDSVLESIDSEESIDSIDLYGGELNTLDDRYVNKLIDISLSYTSNVNVVTNGTQIRRWMLRKDITLSISFDNTRASKDDVFLNLMRLEREYSILALCSKRFKVKDFVTITNNLPDSCVSVELKPYSVSRHNENVNTYDKFIEDTKYLIANSKKQVVNKNRIMDSLSFTYNAFSDNHCYITPNAKVASLVFNKNIEEFLEYNSFEEFRLRYSEKISRTCFECKYYKVCLTEHYRDEEDKNSCSGFYRLLEYYKERIPNFLLVGYGYKKTNTTYTDIVSELPNVRYIDVDKDTLFNLIVKYFRTYTDRITYPVKSYVVALVYGTLIARDFKRGIREVLSYDIFHDTDRYFKPYVKNTERDLYDRLLKELTYELSLVRDNKLSELNDNIVKTIEYYNKEYAEKDRPWSS